MSASILPFPLARRRHFVQRHAGRLAVAHPRAVEKLLAHAIRVQIDTMTRRGIAPNLIEREANALETAIRRELCRLMPKGGVA